MNQLVSVIMPVFNGERYVAETIRSIIAQTYIHWELLIIDDGSTDQTFSIATSFTDTRIRCFRLPVNAGVSAARNYGLRQMRGEFFCFVDADDLYTPQSIESRLVIFSRYTDCRFVDGGVAVYNQDMTSLIRKWTPRYSGEPFKDLCLLTGRCFFGPTWLVRCGGKQAIFFDEELRHAEDLWFYIQLAATGGSYQYTSETILKYRKHQNSAMSNLNGLAAGYTKLLQLINFHFAEQLRVGDRLLISLKARKIMFLSFVAARKWPSAFHFLIFGSPA